MKHVNNVTTFYHKTAIKEEAGSWLVKIDQAPLTTVEIQEFQQWLKRSNYHQTYLEKLAKNWDSMSVLSQLAHIFPETNIEPIVSKPSEFPKVRKLPIWLMTSFSTCLFFVVMILSLSTETIEYSTVIGEQANITLSDGSIVLLNTDSLIQVDFSGDRRVINLMKGEINLEVAKNPNRPLVVYAGSGMIWAIGTIFNVNYTESEVNVLVTEGTVKVYADAAKDKNSASAIIDLTDAEPTSVHETLVTAGQTVIYDEVIKKQTELKQIEFDKKLAWHKGYVSFSGESLEEALKEISRYTDKEFVIANDSIKNIQVGGHFKTHDIDNLLTTIGQGFNIHFEYISDNRINIY
jgi:transmembrane sensor